MSIKKANTCFVAVRERDNLWLAIFLKRDVDGTVVVSSPRKCFGDEETRLGYPHVTRHKDGHHHARFTRSRWRKCI